MALDKYANFTEALLTDALPNMSTATVNCMLLDSTHTPAPNVDTTVADVSGDEVSGTGYTAGGEAVSDVGVSRSGAVTVLEGDDAVWPNSTITARYAVVYEDSTDLLIGIGDFGADEESSDGEFRVNFTANELVEFTSNP